MLETVQDPGSRTKKNRPQSDKSHFKVILTLMGHDEILEEDDIILGYKLLQEMPVFQPETLS